MNRSVLVSLVSLLFVFGVSGPVHAQAAGPTEGQSTVLEVSLQVSGKPVIRNALVEVLNGAPARIASFDDGTRNSGFEIEVTAESLPADLATDGALISVDVRRINEGERSSIADAEVGVLPGSPASVQLDGGSSPLLLEIKLHGQHEISADSVASADTEQCARNDLTSQNASSSCCTRRCGDGSEAWMECCGAIFCCVCGVCCATP